MKTLSLEKLGTLFIVKIIFCDLKLFSFSGGYLKINWGHVLNNFKHCESILLGAPLFEI